MTYQWRILLLLVLFHGVFATITNITVDDEYGDQLTGARPSYSPAAGWGQGANCTGCQVQPDPTFVYDRTWHFATTDSDGYVVNYIFNGIYGLPHLVNCYTNQKLQAQLCTHTVFWQTRRYQT
jgi:hypothetical protein